jgi:hypothetical protein
MKKRMKIRWSGSAFNTLLVFLMLTVGISSCYHRLTEVVRPDPPPEVISYSENIQPIWDARCATSNCHDGRWSPNLLQDVSYNELIGGGYVNVDQPENSSIYTVCAPGGSMAQYTQAGDADLILQWIEEGALNN